MADLRAAGLDVQSVWDLVNTSTPYPDALPVLLKHLTVGGYPDRVMESMGRAMAVGPAAYAWDSLRTLYLASKGKGEEEGLSLALSASATPDRLDDLIALLDDTDRGTSRIHFLRAIKRIGGERGLLLLSRLQGDPLFGTEAKTLVQRKR